MDFKLNNIQRNEIGNRIREFAKYFFILFIIATIFGIISVIDINQSANIIFNVLFGLSAFVTSIIFIYLIYVIIVGFSFIIENTNK